MKLIFSLMLLTSFAASANSPVLSVKERLRLHLWVNGMEEKPVQKVKVEKTIILPEEIERPLRKI
jgi:hypothetical protein